MSKNLYMHTINGRPAMYQDGMYICYVNQWNRINYSDMFVGSLRAIKRQQLWSKQWYEQNGGGVDLDKYGYIRIKVDKDASL